MSLRCTPSYLLAPCLEVSAPPAYTVSLFYRSLDTLVQKSEVASANLIQLSTSCGPVYRHPDHQAIHTNTPALSTCCNIP